jgi:HEAT repeat protein
VSESGETTPPEDDAPKGFSTPGLAVKRIVLPGLVVLLLVLVFVIVGWLTRSPGDVDSLVDALRKDGNARWRAAVSLAGVLRDAEPTGLKSDSLLAARLIEILRQEIRAGGEGEDQIALRMYLCRALGEFYIPEPLAVLVEAARTERDQREADVRRSAIEAIAVLASNVGPRELRASPELISALVEASHDPRPPLRRTAAFTLGVVGGREAEARLEDLLADRHPDVRYNAATGLARHGNVKAVDVLMEMLDPDQSAGTDLETHEAARQFKRTTILINALRASGQLASANPTADLSRLVRPAERLAASHLAPEIRAGALHLLGELKRRKPTSKARGPTEPPGQEPESAMVDGTPP